MIMKSSVKLHPCLWDGMVAAAVAALAIVLAVVPARQASAPLSPLTCTITLNGKTLKSVDLSAIAEGQQERFKITGRETAVIQMECRRVRIKSSTCATRDCVHTGWISRPGQSIVCLPNRLVITLSGGGSSDDVDAVLGQRQSEAQR